MAEFFSQFTGPVAVLCLLIVVGALLSWLLPRPPDKPPHPDQPSFHAEPRDGESSNVWGHGHGEDSADGEGGDR